MNGQQLALIGATEAVTHANQVTPMWREHALAALVSYMTRVVGNADFRMEDVREYAERLGLPPAPDPRAWGAVALRAARAKLIRKVGMTEARNPVGHAHPVSLWRSAS